MAHFSLLVERSEWISEWFFLLYLSWMTAPSGKELWDNEPVRDISHFVGENINKISSPKKEVNFQYLSCLMKSSICDSSSTQTLVSSDLYPFLSHTEELEVNVELIRSSFWSKVGFQNSCRFKAELRLSLKLSWKFDGATGKVNTTFLSN